MILIYFLYMEQQFLLLQEFRLDLLYNPKKFQFYLDSLLYQNILLNNLESLVL